MTIEADCEPAPRAVPTSTLAAPGGAKLRRGAELELRIESFDARGWGVATVRGAHVHVPRALPGELLRCSLQKKKGARWEARALERIEASPSARDADCRHATVCGGCTFQSYAYPSQLEGLWSLVAGEFGARGLLGAVSVEPVVPARETLAYRNKMEFSFSNRRWIDTSEPDGVRADFALGLHPAQFYRKVVDIEACAIQSTVGNAVLASARELAIERQLAPWDTERHTGLLRHLVVRVSRGTGEVLVNLVTAADDRQVVPEFARALVATVPAITTLVHTVHSGNAEKSGGESETTLFGPGAIRERVGAIELWISAQSFFQTNTRQAELLYAMIEEEAALEGGEVVFDLYCGAGSIALWLAPHAARVIGFESVASAVLDARKNAEWNRAANVTFVEGDVLATLDAAIRDGPRPDVCVVDPPRAGLHPRVIPKLVELGPRRIVYVSCNPASAALDLEFVARAGYTIQRIRPIDMFPHTPHVECVIRLERTGATSRDALRT